MNLVNILRMSEDEAREFLEEIRWPDGPVCPRCGNSEKIYELKGKSTRPGLRKCGKCRKPFSVTIGTVMERSHVPLVKWLGAFFQICAHKKGYSANQMSRDLGVTYKTAWFLSHRVRFAMETQQFTDMLSGTVEVDETYIGGKPRRGTTKSSRGYWSKKIPVVSLIERGGNARTFPMERISGGRLKQAVRNNVHKSATIMSDEHQGYQGLRYEFKGGHKTVKHTMDEFARGPVHINTTESYFALLKRGVYGTFHHVSKHHLHRYCAEFDHRWNHRDLDDDEIMIAAVRKIAGKRLYYRGPKAA